MLGTRSVVDTINHSELIPNKKLLVNKEKKTSLNHELPIIKLKTFLIIEVMKGSFFSNKPSIKEEIVNSSK